MVSYFTNMRVAIDVSQVVYGTGVSVYTKNLVKNLIKNDSENEYLLFAGTLRRRTDVLNMFPQTKVFPIPPSLADLLWNRLHVFPIEKLVGMVDVLHTSDWTEPPSTAFKVTTIHDLYPLKFPRMIDANVAAVHKRRLDWVFRESRRIIVPSVSTKNDLLSIGVREDVIRVIPEAPSVSKATAEAVIGVRLKYKINEDYIIAVGVTKLKNTERIVSAFHLAKAGKDVKLLLVGNPSGGITLKQERNVRVLGHVPTPDLAALITGSQGLIFASLYEGFGIPILDGMECEVPVITSNFGSMAEVAGGGAILVDPYNIDSIKDAIEKILRGAKAIVEKGSRRVKEFTWQKTATKTLAVYNEVREIRKGGGV
jgi:glycosyltransferase involved in cell wall biosynthesis